MPSGLLDELPRPVVQDLISVATRRSYPARSFLFHEGDDSSSVVLVETGLLRIDRVTQSGRQVLFELAFPGESVGELGVIDASPRSATCATVKDSTVLSITATDFRRLLTDRPEFSTIILGRTVRRLRALSDQLVEATGISAAPRVAARLVMMVELAGAGDANVIELNLPITQEELGQWAGLSREGVGKGLSELRSRRILETGRRKVKILDLGALRNVAASA